ADRTKRSRSAQCGFFGSCVMNRVNRTVAMSAAPMGNPGWPEFAFSTASMDRNRIAFAIRSCFSREIMFARSRGGWTLLGEQPPEKAGDTQQVGSPSQQRAR